MKLRGRYSKFEPEDVHFTKAEKRILLLLTKGRERQEICHVLHISMNTLLSTLGTIRKKGRILVKNLP
jgi:DNA-binding CsgD family transcriptional regulator